MEQETPQRKFNLRRDQRTDHPHHEFALTRAILPAKVDLRSKLPPVYDQGSLGSCTANAIGAAYQFDQMNHHTTFAANQLVTPFIPSRLFVYYNERAMEGTIPNDYGAAIEDGVASVSNVGVCPETMWPYDISKFTQKPPAETYKYATMCRVTSCKKITQSEQQLKTALAQGYPIIFGMQIFASFQSDTVATTGNVPMPFSRDECLGGHAVLICGYDNDKSCFIVRNSWGVGWGDKGYFYLPYKYVLDSKLCSDFWVLYSVTREISK